MSQPVQIGRETTHGTVAGTFYSAPVNFDAHPVIANTIPDEQRGVQDIHYTIIPGRKHEAWSVSDSMVYHDSIGFWLGSALGLGASTLVEAGVYDSVFKFLDDPTSVSLKWTQPRRVVQAYQSLWCVVDRLTLSFDASGQLMVSAEGVGMAETEVGALTFTFTTTVPHTAWEGTVTLGGGAFARLVKGTVTMMRNRNPFPTINNSTDPVDFSIGNRSVEFDLTADFNSKTEYDRYKSGATTALTIVWEDADVLIGATAKPRCTVKLGTIGYTESEIDSATDFPGVALRGKAIYNAADASLAVVTIRSTRQYQTA